MNPQPTIKGPSPGDWALITAEFELFELSDDISSGRICHVVPYQKVEIASTPEELRHPTTGKPTIFIMVKIVDIAGTHRFLRVNIDILLFAANKNIPSH
jgi:hypothetical protein